MKLSFFYKALAAAIFMANIAGAVVAADQPIVGLITKTEINPFFVKMKEGAQQAAATNGVRLLTGAGKADGDNAGQVAVLENMVAAGAKTILITPSDSKAIVPALKKAMAQGVMVIALDSATEPAEAVDALFATDNFQAGVLIGQYAKAAMAGKQARIAMIDLFPGNALGLLRHNGFLSGFGVPGLDARRTTQLKTAEVLCMTDSYGDQTKAQTAMENCIQKSPDINLVYTVNEPAAAGVYKALQAAGKQKDVMIVSIDGGCTGIRDVQRGVIAATSQQYPLTMAALGVEAGAAYARTGKKASGYHDTGATLISGTPLKGIASKDVSAGLAACWGKK